MSAHQYEKNSFIHHGDKDCLGLIYVETGSIRTYILSEEGKEITLYRINPGEICVLSAGCVLDEITFEVHMTAEEDSQVISINPQAISQLIENNIYFENFTLKLGMKRFSEVMWTMEQILFMSFDKRLARFLLDEQKDNSLSLTHEQIANYLGTAREVVSRMLKYFEQEGMVTLGRGLVTIIDKEKLSKLA